MTLLYRNLGNTLTIALTIATAAVLGACGGGGDDAAGSPTPFGTQPTDYTLTALTPAAGGPIAGQCSAAYAVDVVIVGGAAPYRLVNTAPNRVPLHKSSTDLTPVSTVDARNGTFSVSFGSSCFDPSTVSVFDKLDNRVILTLHNKPAT